MRFEERDWRCWGRARHRSWNRRRRLNGRRPKRPRHRLRRGRTAIACSAADGSPLDTGASEVRPVIERYEVELRDLNRVYPLPGSAVRQAKLEKFYIDQLQLLDRIHFDAMSQPGKVDYLLLRSRLEREQKQIIAEGRRDAEIQALIPFQQTIIGFEEARRRMETIDGQKSAIALERLIKDIAVAKDSMSGVKKNPAALNGAAQRLEQLRGSLRGLVRLLRALRSEVRLVGGCRIQEGG